MTNEEKAVFDEYGTAYPCCGNCVFIREAGFNLICNKHLEYRDYNSIKCSDYGYENHIQKLEQLRENNMTQEEKRLLLIDLCGRLPHGVKCYAYQYRVDGNHCECCGTLDGVLNGYFYLSDRVSVNGGKTYDERYLEVKPYLRPMSSMTEEEKKQYKDYFNSIEGRLIGIKGRVSWLIDWFNSHYFDYRGLIPMGLALEAPEGMYKID